ncbi:MAG: VWA domain-containing protein [archaeon]
MPIKEFKADLIPKLHELDMYAKRRILSTTLSGNLITNFKGRGFEFEGYRSFTPNDDASFIDWKASLRSNRLLIREYDVEKNFNAFFLIDVSDSMLFSSVEKLKCEYAAEVVSNLAFGIIEAGAGLGFGMFTDKLVCKLAPIMGKRQYYFLVKELTNVNNYGGNFDLEAALKFTLSVLKEKAMIIIISDFFGLKGSWYKYMQILSQKFEVMGIAIRDPRDSEIPRDAGQYILQDPYSNEKIYIDASQYYDLYKKQAKEDVELLKRKFTLLRSDLLTLQTNETYTDKIIKFLKKKREKMEVIFDYPLYLILLLSIPLLVVTHFYLLRHIRRKAMKFANFEALRRVTGSDLITKNMFLLVFRCVTLTILVFSAAGPVIWYKGKENHNDYVITIDTSASMLAEDFFPDRLRAAKKVATDFLGTLDLRTQVAVVSFSGIPKVESLLSSETSQAMAKINELEIMAAGGTDIGSAIVTSTNILLLGRKSKTIILLTDGSQTTGTFVDDSLKSGVAYAKKNHVIIHTIGIGTGNAPSGYLPINVSASYEKDSLAAIALQTGGKFFEANNEEELAAAFSEINALKDEAYLDLDLRFGLLMIGVLMLFLEWGLLSTKYRAVP